jgi:subtilisin family serine protease
MSHPWISQAADPAALADALAQHDAKIPAEFRDRLKWALPDGTLRVMVALAGRDAAAEAFVDRATTWRQWYGDASRFLARVTQEQLVALLKADVVRFVEPDYQLKNFMASSSLDVHARGTSSTDPAVWSYDPSAGPMGALKSNIPGLTADQATGKGVTVAITDSGIDRTFRDFGGWDCEAGPYQPCESRILRAVSIEHLVDAGADPGDSLPTTEAASGHGTHVAGTVAGNAYYQRDGSTPTASDITTYGGDGYNFGIAPQANLVSTKNGDVIWAGLSSMGLQWQLDHAEEYGIRVSSNSWGCIGGCSFNGNSAAAQLYKDMYNAGIVVVFAAGNDGGGSDGASYAGDAQSPYVLGVANYNDADHRLNSSSSRGSDNTLPAASTWTPQSEPINGERRPDVAAPGTSIWSAGSLTGGAASVVPRQSANDVTGGENAGLTREYRSMTGTSMSTPHVAGAAAVMFSACPNAAPLDVMRAVMVGADATEVLKTAGSGTAEPFEVGYGSLEVRRSVNWLLSQPACGGTGGGTTDPTPTATPTPTPTTTSAPTSGPATRYYFHSGSGVHAVDAAEGTAAFDTSEPEFTEPSVATDVPVVGNAAPSVWDPLWTGTVDRPINSLTVDFWAKVPEEEAQSGAVTWAVDLWNGETPVDLPLFVGAADDVTAPVHVQHTFTTMLQDGEEVPLSVSPSGPLGIQIRGNFSVNSAGTTIFFDSVDMPSGFSVGGEGSGPTPTPTPTETTEPTPEPTTPTNAGTRGVYPLEPNDEYFGPGRNFGPTDAIRFDTQWGPQKIQAPQAWQEPQATGYAVDVAVLDSGVDLGHPDLDCEGKLNVVSNSDMVAPDGDPQDENGHGTHVAGIIGACTNNETGIAGVAPDARIMPIRVLDAEGNGTVEQIVGGIRRATSAGAEVINMSLSQREISSLDLLDNADFDAAIQEAAAAGVVIVAAAGNDGFTVCNYPALVEEVVCVGATDSRDNKSWYSNFADKARGGAAVVAPGGLGFIDCGLDSEEILSLFDRAVDAANDCDGRPGYADLNGTSMAAPHVAGVAALVYDRLGAVRSAENRNAVIAALTSSAVDLGAPGYDPVFGSGRVDALAAVQAVDAVVPEPTETPTPTPTAAATDVSFTGASATAAQYSDAAMIEAVLKSNGLPIANQDLVFELTGAAGTRSWTVATDASGEAKKRVQINDEPGTYQLMVRYPGRDGTYLPSGDTSSFVVDQDDSATSLAVTGKGSSSALSSTTTDADSGSGLAGAIVEFLADGRSLGTATTGSNGTATMSLPSKYRNGHHAYEVVFPGDAYYDRSAARQQT